jgi:hypothetical protein
MEKVDGGIVPPAGQAFPHRVIAYGLDSGSLIPRFEVRKTVKPPRISNGTPGSPTPQSLWTGCGSSSVPRWERARYTCGT